MRIFFFLVLCIASLTATAQTITLPHPDSIATKEWVRKLLQGQEPPAVPSVPVVPELDPCKAGPEIRQITGITQSGAVFQFHGENVFSLQWEIIGTTFSATVKPTSNQILLSYKLEPGTYTLRIQGVNCAGVSTRSFIVPGLTGEVKPIPEQVPDPLPATEVKPQIVTRGYDHHINIQISGSSGNWILNDIAEIKQPENYEWWYYIGGDIIKTDQPLRNYAYQTDAPLRVLKMAGKRGLQSFNYWGDESWQDKDAGWGFERNISGAFMTFIFPHPKWYATPASPQGEGLSDAEIEFYNPVPANFTVDGFQQWGKFPAAKLPKDHIYHMRKIRKYDSVEKLLSAGVTHISNYDLPWEDHGAVADLRNMGVTYNDVPNNNHIFNLPDTGVDNYVNGYNTRHWPNGELTEEQARSAARFSSWADHAIWIGQTEEGSAYMPADRPMWGWFYDELKKVYQERFGARGIPYYIAHNYFWIGMPKGFDLKHCTRAEAKAALVNVPVNRYSPGHSLENTNLIIEGIYNSFPDGSVSVYEKLHKLELFRKMGKTGALFAFGVHEWRPNNYYRIDMPEGTLYRQDKMPVDPNYLVSMSFFSHVYGKGMFEWGPVPSNVTEKKPMHPDQLNADKWFPNGATDAQAFPWYSQSNYYSIYTGSSDFIHIGQLLYSNTFADFDQQPLKYAKFRVDGGEWFQPTTDGSDLVDAFHDKRAIVGYKVKDNRIALFYIHPTTNSHKKQLEIEINGKVYTATVAGTGVHASVLEL